jgi:hypothetical protein
MSGHPRCRPAAEYRANEARFPRGRGPLGRDRYCTPLAFRDSHVLRASRGSPGKLARKSEQVPRVLTAPRALSYLFSRESHSRTLVPRIDPSGGSSASAEFHVNVKLAAAGSTLRESPRRNRYRISEASSFTRDYQFTSAGLASRPLAQSRDADRNHRSLPGHQRPS